MLDDAIDQIIEAEEAKRDREHRDATGELSEICELGEVHGYASPAANHGKASWIGGFVPLAIKSSMCPTKDS